LLLWAEDHDYTKFRESYVRYLLPVALVFLSMMMVSQVKYPTFKKLDFRATRTFPKMVAIVLVIGFFVILWDKVLHFVLPAAFAAYLIYGFVRPFISRQMRHDIEDEDEEAPATPG
jgi:CDP-diacylglycerol--serine O-phosphatidyltransferase